MPIDPSEEPLRFSSSTEVLGALANNQAEELRAQREQYRYYLSEMDISQAALAHMVLSHHGIDHASPAGYAVFKSPEERLAAIKLLHAAEPQRLGWKWRDISGRPTGEMTTGEWTQWRRTRPIHPQYLEDTSEDPKRKLSDNSVVSD